MSNYKLPTSLRDCLSKNSSNKHVFDSPKDGYVKALRESG